MQTMYVCMQIGYQRATTGVKANLLFVLRKPEVGNSNKQNIIICVKLQQDNSLYEIYVCLTTDRQSDRLTDMASSTPLLLLIQNKYMFKGRTCQLRCKLLVKTNIPSLYNYKTS